MKVTTPGTVTWENTPPKTGRCDWCEAEVVFDTPEVDLRKADALPDTSFLRLNEYWLWTCPECQKTNASMRRLTSTPKGQVSARAVTSADLVLNDLWERVPLDRPRVKLWIIKEPIRACLFEELELAPSVLRIFESEAMRRLYLKTRWGVNP